MGRKPLLVLGVAGFTLAGCRAVAGLSDLTFEEGETTAGGGAAGTTGQLVGSGGGGSVGAGGHGGAGGGAAPSLCDPSDPTLIACYTFEDVVVDASSKANSTVASKVSFGSGVDGAALQLDASSLVLADTASWGTITNFTLELWFNAAEVPSLFGKRAMLFDNDARLGAFLGPGGVITCTMGTSSTTVLIEGSDATPDTWIHVACVHEGEVGSLYVNGLLDKTAKVVSLSTLNEQSAIGSNIPSGDPFIGLLDNLRVFSTARTKAQICEAAGKPGC